MAVGAKGGHAWYLGKALHISLVHLKLEKGMTIRRLG